MKKVLAILLASLMLLVSTKDLAIYALFKANQEYLAANVCINRFSPEELCFADCVLEQTIVQSQEQHDRQSGISLEQQSDVIFVFDKMARLPALIAGQSSVVPSKKMRLPTTTFLTDIFQPPEV